MRREALVCCIRAASHKVATARGGCWLGALRRFCLTGGVPRLVLRLRAGLVAATVVDGASHEEKDDSAAGAARDGGNRHAATSATIAATIAVAIVPTTAASPGRRWRRRRRRWRALFNRHRHRAGSRHVLNSALDAGHGDGVGERTVNG